MSNDWYNNTTTAATRLGTARSSDYNAKFAELVTSFGLLPGRDEMHEGRINYAADTGAADAYVVTLSKAPSSYSAGMAVHFKVGAGNTNTGASTINVNSVGAAGIKRTDGTALMAGDLTAGDLVAIRYDGSNFRITSNIRNVAMLDVPTSQAFKVAGTTRLNLTSAGAAVTGTFSASGAVTFTSTSGVKITSAYPSFDTIETGVGGERRVFDGGNILYALLDSSGVYAENIRTTTVVGGTTTKTTEYVGGSIASTLDGTGLAIGASTATETLDVNGDAIRVRSSQTPASASATGSAGMICWDTSYIYVCTATDTWKRAALSTW